MILEILVQYHESTWSEGFKKAITLRSIFGPIEVGSLSLRSMFYIVSGCHNTLHFLSIYRAAAPLCQKIKNMRQNVYFFINKINFIIIKKSFDNDIFTRLKLLCNKK